jgi:hypothetical protein
MTAMSDDDDNDDDDGKGKQGGHDDGDGRHDDSKGRHGDSKRQQGDRRHDDGDGRHDDGDGRHDDGKAPQPLSVFFCHGDRARHSVFFARRETAHKRIQRQGRAKWGSLERSFQGRVI